MEREELAAWLLLLRAEGLGRRRALRLLRGFGSALAVVQASAEAIAATAGREAAVALHAAAEDLGPIVEATWRWLGDQQERRLIALDDPRYPAKLLQAPSPPLALFAHGDVTLLQQPSISIVGSRHATAQGLENARHFSASLARAGWCVVSGLALGIDGAAHRGALDAQGSTIAVVGTGLDLVYPRRHRDLAHEIARCGLIVSEFLLGTPGIAHHFPRRNRIIASLSLGTLVIEAAMESGSLITARMANDCGREVFAIPGSIHAPQSRGCHALVRQGATLVETVDDIVNELRPILGGQPIGRQTGGPCASQAPAEPGCPGDAVGVEPSADPVLQALAHEPASIDTLQTRTAWPMARLNAHLLQLELAGSVARMPGALYQKI